MRSRQRREAERNIRRALPDLKGLHLPDMRHLHLPEMKDLHLPELHAPEIDWGRGRMGSRAASLWPALFAAAGTGAAVWWWNQWARGRAEAEAAAAAEGAPPPHALDSPEDRLRAADGAATNQAPSEPEAKVDRQRKAKPPAGGSEELEASLAVQGSPPPAGRPER